MVELIGMAAAALHRAVIRREVRAREVVDAHIAQIERVNAAINAVVVRRFAEARREADALDAALARGEAEGALAGVPITVKESFDLEGFASTAGLTARAQMRARQDAVAVARLRAAGAIVLGKTNVPTLLLANESDNPLYGRTSNPWDTSRAPGGSSGGEAAIIAAGGSPLGLGSDIGGSVRLPAHACGIHSLKPGSGIVPLEGHLQFSGAAPALRIAVGPLARSVTDLALAMSVLAGTSARIRNGIAGLRIGFFTDNGVIAPSPAVRRAVREAAAALGARGAHVDEWQPPDSEEAWDLYVRLMYADGMAKAREALRGSRVDLRTRQLVDPGAMPPALLEWSGAMMALAGQRHFAKALARLRRLDDAGLAEVLGQREAYRRRFLESLDLARLDAIVCPPDALPALPHGSSPYLADALSYCALFNLLDMPAGVVSTTYVAPGEESDRGSSIDGVVMAASWAERGSAGLPVGVQVAARESREDVVLALMHALEPDTMRFPPARP
ncbi:MAG: amidase [Betaproteobacteria bacterium]